MVNLPSLRQLQYLVALHKHRHFSKAAKDCDISQSTLSAAIAQLEEVLDCQLLERSHKTFTFTHVGDDVVKDAKVLIQSSVDMLNFTRRQTQPMSGQLVLGCIPTIAPFVLNQVGKAANIKFPQLKLLPLEVGVESLLQGLHEGYVDMAILGGSVKTDGLVETVLAEDLFNLVIHKELMEIHQTKTVKKLPEQSIFVLNDSHCLHHQVLSDCKVSDKRKLYPFEANSLATLVQMVDAQRGATFLPQMAVNSNLLNGTDLIARRAEPNGIHRKITLVWRKSHKCLDTLNNLSTIISEIVRIKCLQ